MPETPKERPILFSGPMVRAILDGSKTQTRRVFRGDVPEDAWEYNKRGDIGYLSDKHPITWLGKQYWQYGAMWGSQPRTDRPFPKCPYGLVADRLWVRETWTQHDTDGESWVEIGYRADDAVQRFDVPMEVAEHQYGVIDHLEVAGDGGMNWHPSIHMPRWASRISLEITEVRVERLQAIGDRDAAAEGVEVYARAALSYDNDDSPVDRFRYLWDSLNAPRGFGWDVNPWVWVIAFRRVEDSADVR